MIIYICVGTLAFGGLPSYHEIGVVFIMFFETSLGQWDLSIYYEENEDGEHSAVIEKVGIIFHMIFLLINLVLMLNLVIAILANTFNQYESLSNGLYYSVLIRMFPLYEWDN